MKHGTISAGIFNYTQTGCNAYGCTASAFRGLLCKHHWDTYATSNEVVGLLDNIQSINFGTPSPELLKTVASNHRRHNLTGLPLPYVEHFPLESLFHVARSTALSERHDSQEQALIASAKRVKSLIDDFGWPRNEWLAQLRVHYAELTGDLSSLYHSDLTVAPRALAFFPLRAERMWAYATILFGCLMLAQFLKPISVLGFFSPWQATPQMLLTLYVAYVGVVVFGLFAFQSIDVVGQKAGKHKLYVDSYANRIALLTFGKIRARFDSRSDLDYVTMGVTAMSAVLIVGSMIWNRWEFSPRVFAVAAEAILLLPCVYSVSMIYGIYANASVALSELPASEFMVDSNSKDGRFGVAPVADLVLAILIFNCSLLLLLSFVVPALIIDNQLSLAIYMLLVSPILHMRIVQIRRAWQLRASLLLSVRSKTNSRPDVLSESSRKGPGFLVLLLSKQTMRRLEFLAATVVLPVILMIGDKYYKDIFAWFSAVSS